MRRHLMVGLTVVALGGGAAVLQMKRAAADDAPKITVEVVGIRNCAASYKDLMPLGAWTEGVSIALLVKADGCQVTGMDSASRVKEVGDDTGADIFVGSSESGRQTGFGQNVQVAKDASALMIEVDNPSPVTKGAKGVKAEGKLVLHTANGTEEKKVAVSLEAGGKFEAGPLKVEVEKVEETGSEELPLAVVLKSSKSFEAIAAWKFVDESGAEIKTWVNGSWSTGSGADAGYQLAMNLGKKVAKATAVLEVRKDMKNVTVPFKVDVPLGF